MTALLVDRHKRGHLRHRGGSLSFYIGRWWYCLLVKKGSYRALVGDTARNKYYYDPKNRNEKFYNLGNEQYRYPERFGILFDAYGSSKVGNMLDDNEKSIKKYIWVE